MKEKRLTNKNSFLYCLLYFTIYLSLMVYFISLYRFKFFSTVLFQPKEFPLVVFVSWQTLCFSFFGGGLSSFLICFKMIVSFSDIKFSVNSFFLLLVLESITSLTFGLNGFWWEVSFSTWKSHVCYKLLLSCCIQE